MTVKDFVAKAESSIQRNSPTILTGIGVAGVGITAYLAATGGQEAGLIIAKEIASDPEERELSRTEKLKLTWKCYIPAAASGALTVGCVVLGARAQTKRLATALSLLAVSETAFGDYREKVVETFGKTKAQKVKDDIVQDKVNANPPPANMVIGTGKVLCLDDFSGRYFECDMETLRKAENTLNQHLNKGDRIVELSEFYELIGLPHTGSSDLVGWTSGDLIDLEFTSVLSPDGRPCLCFAFKKIKPI